MRLLGPFRGEQGIALPMALGVMVATGALVVSVIEFSSSSSRTANVAKGRISAEALAEAGLASAFSVLNKSGNNPASATLLGCDSSGSNCVPFVNTYIEGTATWFGSLNTSTSLWTITSTGQVTNPTGGTALQKTLKASVQLVAGGGTPNASVWNYLYSTKTPGTGCEVDVGGSNVVIDIPLYVEGDLCLGGSNTSIDERGEGQTPAPQPIDLRVGGKLVYTGSNATVGISSDSITSAAVAGGCTTNIGNAGVACTRPPFAWYVTTVNTFQAIAEPAADYASWFAHNDTINSTSTTGGQDGDCDVRSGTPPAINPDTVLDADAGTVNLFPGSDYTCRKTVDGTPGGAVVAELSCNCDVSPKVLTVKGVIVVDGVVSVTASDLYATYNGTASLYVNGGFTLNGSNSYICANSSCDFTTWNPNTEMLLVVATSIAINGSNNRWQGGLFCNPTSTAAFGGGSSSNVSIHGPVVCGTFTFGSNTEFKPLPGITQVPIGAPTDPNVSLVPSAPSYGGG